MTPRIVIDTNVLYAGLRSRHGASFLILEAVWARRITPLLSQIVLQEYEEILKYHAHTLGLTLSEIDIALDFLCSVAERFEHSGPWDPILRDADDEAFVKLAVAGRADYLVTHNLRDFGPAAARGINLLAPRDLLAIIRL
jgi:putative PIN family toxin of toxin-antitoxin system